jgi:copper transport protein
MRRLGVVVLALLALSSLLPAAALAHARFLRSEPADGEVLARSPAVVRILFDDTVRPGGANAVVRNGGGSVRAGPARVVRRGRVLEIPLRPSLPVGDYTVRWDVVSDDGHDLRGVLAFGVGAGRASPVPTLSAGGGVQPDDVVFRWLFFAGLLVAAGTVAGRLLVRRELAGARRVELRVFSALMCAGLLLASIGASVTGHAGSGTRSGTVYEIATVGAAAGALLAALAYVTAVEAAWLAPAAIAVALVATPTLGGHALDRDQNALAPVADVIHVASAAVWLGVLLTLGLVVPLVSRSLPPAARDGVYRRIAPRASGVVVVSVVLLAATGVVRAIGELSAVDQLWTTGYGRTILVKTALLMLLLAAGWQNRYRIVPRLARAARPAADALRLRRNVVAELGGFVLLVCAVALLTDLVPGVRAGPAAAPAAAGTPVSAPLPPKGSVVLGGQARELAVNLAARPAGVRRVALTATVIGQDAGGVRGLDLSFGLDGASGTEGEPCGSGCYEATVPSDGSPRRATVRVSGPGRAPATVDFELGESWPPPPGAAVVRRAGNVFRGLRTLTSREELESRPGNRIVTHWTFAAPNRLTYRIERGAQAVVVGARRWDKATRDGPWKASPQTPLSLPAAPWARVRDARLLGKDTVDGKPVDVVSFLDPTVPAWFTIRVDPETGRTLRLRMAAAAHFMSERYTGFDEPLEIRPPR